MPLSEAKWGLPAVLSVMVIEALRGPNWVGVKVTLMVQFAPAARLDPQVLFWLKSVTFAPERATLAMDTAAVPALVKATVCGPLKTPTSCGAKLRLEESVTVSGSKRMESV
jgi:hypothetical protein